MSNDVLKNNVSLEQLLAALSLDYGSVYYVEVDKNSFIPFRLSDPIKKQYGSMFASNPTYDAAISVYIKSTVAEEDCAKMLRDTEAANLRKQLNGKNVYTRDFKAFRDGVYFYCRMKVVRISEPDAPLCVAMGFADISFQKERELEQYAYVDAVTGGHNYNFFKEAVVGKKISGCFISMDIHSFKIINKVCGTKTGDSVIKEINRIVGAQIGFKDVSGRINADHFAIYVNSEDEKYIEDLINRITIELVTLSVKMQTPQLIPYFGITRWNPEKKIEMLLSEANTAKHAIKESSEINFSFYDEEDASRLLEEKKMEDDFEESLKSGCFEIWYQEKCDSEREVVVGAEALVRWRQKDGTILPPGKFIPIFERNGMIRELDEYVFNQVCRQQKEWIEAGHKIVPVSINISRASLYFLDVVDVYKKITERWGIETKYVPIEITESATIDNDEIKEIVNAFHNAGFPLHLDDFGTGYSSLATLNVMHFDTLKLDKTLVDYIGNYGGDRVLDHTISLAKELGMHVTAEGVENKEQADFLNNLCCDSIQGYYYAKPQPAEIFTKKLATAVFNDNELSVVTNKRTREKSENIYIQAMEVYLGNFHKILKINLTTDSFEIIKFYFEENDTEHGYSQKISEWLQGFADAGFVHPDDTDNYKRMVSLEYLKNYFIKHHNNLRIRYRRKVNSEFCWVLMELVAAPDYSDDNQTIMLYVQDLHEELIPDLK